MLHRMVGDHAGAYTAAREAIETWYELGNLGRLPLAVKILAALELQRRRASSRRPPGGRCERLSDDIGGDLYQVFGQLGDPIEEARPLLSPAEHARAVEEGRTLPLADQVAFALHRDDG